MAQVGYPDFQRVVNWDSPELWSEDTPGTTSYVLSPMLNVKDYGYLAGRVWESSYLSRVGITWYLDEAGTISTGSRVFVLDASVTDPMVLRIPNLGPWCQVRLDGWNNNNFTAHARIFATNRYTPTDIIPTRPVILYQAQEQINPGQNYAFNPTSYHSGPAALLMDTGGANVEVTLHAYDYTEQDFTVYDHSPTGATEIANIIIPPTAFYINAYGNGSVAGTFGCALTPSMTGSS